MAAGQSILDIESRAEARSAINSPGAVISDRMYNLVMGAVTAWGLLVNVVMCVTCSKMAVAVVAGNPLLFGIAYLVLAIAGVFIAHKSHNPIISFVGYNMIVIPLGLEISAVVALYGGMNAVWVQNAFAYTLFISAIMICASLLVPQFFQKIGRVLFACLIGLMVLGVVVALLGGGTLWLSYGAAVIFSLYIGFDFWKSQQYAKTVDNAVDSAVDLYLDIALLFLQLLRIFSNNR